MIKSPRHADEDIPRQRMFGLAVLLLTFSAGYALAQRGVPAATAEPVEEATDADARPVPGVAEIIARIEEVAARHGVSPRLVAAIVAVESEFNPHAVSRTGAQGLMQLMPATAAGLEVQDSFDADENIEGGVRHLRALMDRFHNDLPLVLAAYNAGEQAVVAYRGIPPYRETRQYVIRVLRLFDADAARAVARQLHGPVTAARTPSVPSGGTRLVFLESATLSPRPGGTEAPLQGATGPSGVITPPAQAVTEPETKDMARPRVPESP